MAKRKKPETQEEAYDGVGNFDPDKFVAGMLAQHKVNQQRAADEAQMRANIAAIADAVSAKSHKNDPPLGSKLETEIWAALDGRAMTKQQLADAVCGGDSGRLYKPKDKPTLTRMKESGYIDHKQGFGFYRPDSPPPEMKLS